MEHFDYYTIEKPYGKTYRNDNNEVVVYGHGVYDDSSILAGQDKRTWLEAFDTIEEAQKAYPVAQVVEGSTFRLLNLDYLPDRNGLPYEEDV